MDADNDDDDDDDDEKKQQLKKERKKERKKRKLEERSKAAAAAAAEEESELRVVDGRVDDRELANIFYNTNCTCGYVVKLSAQAQGLTRPSHFSY